MTVGFIVQALYILTKLPVNKVSHIIFNSTVIYWKICQPFFKEGNRGPFVNSLEIVVKALEDISDTDYNWRVRYL